MNALIEQLQRLPEHALELGLLVIVLVLACGLALLIARRLSDRQVDRFFDGRPTGYSDPGRPRVRRF